MAISVQPRAELAVCWKIGLSNGLKPRPKRPHQAKDNNLLLRIIRAWWKNDLNTRF
jgi:hypothetical protein